MGCCISKCSSKKDSIDVEDKLGMSNRTPKITPVISSSNKISPISPPSPTSTSSVSSFPCSNSNNSTTTSTISTCSSLSSGSSFNLSSKDRSFSNEFLWSRLKENPRIIRVYSIKECSQLLVPHNVHPRKLDSPARQASSQLKQPIQQRVNASTQQKRIRSNSPTTLSRQKSFRRELDQVNSSYWSKSLRSPSPSKRFSNGESGRKCRGNDCFASSKRKENLNPQLMNSSSYLRSCIKNANRETCIHRVSSKIDEVAVEEALAHHLDGDSVPLEDFGNPLISLGCFIFL